MISQDFVQHWYDRGLAENDAVNKFFSYYVALNYLYKGIDILDSNIDSQYSKECRRLLSLVKKYKDRNNDYNPYMLLTSSSKIITSPVKELNYNKTADIEKLKSEDIYELFCSIYYVRCNIFHGSKSPFGERNKSLIEECNLVMGDFLKNLLNERN